MITDQLSKVYIVLTEPIHRLKQSTDKNDPLTGGNKSTRRLLCNNDTILI